ncbi:MAG: hypothetical protein ACOC6I_01995 [Candidatus Bipolaricaulota bacterium]
MKNLKLSKIAKISVCLTLVLTLFAGASFSLMGEQNVEVNAEIGAKLIFNAAPKKLKLSVDPENNPTAQAGHRLRVKTNAPTYGITAAYGTFEVGDYDLIGNGNLTVASEAPGSGEGTGGSFIQISDEVEILAGESGRTNNEVTPVTYQLDVDFTVPYGDAETTVVYTATMST